MKQENPPFYVLIAAAGHGARMGSDTPKQYLKLKEKAILRHTIETFLKIDGLMQLRVIIDPNHETLYHDAVKGLDLPPPALGSKERNSSIFNGLKSFSNLKNEDLILIHDGVRPLISTEDVSNLLNTLKTTKAATLATPISSTLRKERNGSCTDIVPRDNLWAIQTPQGFHYGDIIKAHETAASSSGVTDDTTLLSAMGIDVKIVKGSANNIKITTQDDLQMAEKLLSPPISTDIRTGQGFDVHAFDTEKDGPLRIGGIDIPHDHPLKGHSDADVALHTITDAILGAIGQGDIGQHFPPSDNTFKNMDSAIFLEKAMQMLSAQSATLNNIDLTIICEAPKIGPHAAAMKARIAEITGLAPTRINIKATTTEQLGFTGRREGIAAQAIATVSLP